MNASKVKTLQQSLHFTGERKTPTPLKMILKLYRKTGKDVHIIWFQKKRRKDVWKWKYQGEFSPEGREHWGLGESVVHFAEVGVT